MKIPGIVLFTLTTFVLSACASSQPAPAPAAASGATPSKTDTYRQVVENHALKSGARVTWVNLPDEDDLANKFNPEVTKNGN